MNQKGKITASLNCSRFSDLQNVIQICRTAGADYLHVDLMDGIFVSIYGLSVDYVKEIRALSHMPLDFHFMVVEPQQKVQWVQPQIDLRTGLHRFAEWYGKRNR